MSIDMQHMFPLTSLSCQYICRCLGFYRFVFKGRVHACVCACRRVLTRVAARTLEEASLLEPNIFSPLDIQEGGGGGSWGVGGSFVRRVCSSDNGQRNLPISKACHPLTRRH